MFKLYVIRKISKARVLFLRVSLSSKGRKRSTPRESQKWNFPTEYRESKNIFNYLLREDDPGFRASSLEMERNAGLSELGGSKQKR